MRFACCHCKYWFLMGSRHMPYPLSWWRVRCWVACLGKVSPKLEHVLAGGFVLSGEHGFHGDDATLEQHEEFICMSYSELSWEKVQANELTKILKNKRGLFVTLPRWIKSSCFMNYDNWLPNDFYWDIKSVVGDNLDCLGLSGEIFSTIK